MVKDLGPLDWRTPIVDPETGAPSPEFQRRWNTQRSNNTGIGSLSIGSGAPPADPAPTDGLEYVDISATPPVFYVGSAGVWDRVGVLNFTDLADVPHSYAGDAGKLLQVDSGEDGVVFISLSALLDAIMGSTEGDLLVRGATVWEALAAGASGDVLTSGGASTVPSWQAPAAGVTVYFGTGAPSTTHNDGDLYFDRATTPYTGYVQDTGAWHAFGSTGGGGSPVSALTHIGANGGGGLTAVTCGVSSAVAAGSLIVIYTHESNNVVGSGVTDTAGNTYHLAVSATNGGNGLVAFWYAYNCTALTTSDTITYTPAVSTTVGIDASFATGADTTSAVLNGTGSSTTTASASVTPTKNGCLIVGATEGASGQSAGFSAPPNPIFGGFDIAGSLVAAGSTVQTYTGGGASSPSTIIVAFGPP